MIEKIFPPIETALHLEPEELALPLLEVLCQLEAMPSYGDRLHRPNFMNYIDSEKDYCKEDQRDPFKRALTEAWMWLEHEGLIAPRPTQERDWVFVTRRGYEFREKGDLRIYKASKMLPDKVIDPALLSKVQSAFLRTEFETAVFAAYKEVEVRVRKAAGYSQDAHGTDLMRKAFEPKNGALTDISQPKGEQEAISHLFAGAIGSFKNPSSHRDVGFNEYSEALELIMLADLLIKIAKKRARSHA